MSGKNQTGFAGAMDPDERRLILVGKTGVGKSAAGNTILGREAFESELSPSSMTSECHKAKGDVYGRSVAVIDTPGLFDTNFTQEDVLKRIKMCISLAAPGPHAFLVVLQLGRFTQEEKETVKMIQTTFGEEAAKYTMVLFTHGDHLKTQSIESFIAESSDLTALIRTCNNRYHVFNNEVKDPKQAYQLMDKIDKMIMVNGGSYYTNEMFMKAEEAIEKEKERLLKEMEEQKQRELAQLRARYGGQNLREEGRLHMRYENLARSRAEKFNGFTAAPAIAISTAAGAAIGGALGLFGGPIGLAVGLAAGAAVGAVAGAIAVGVSKNCHVHWHSGSRKQKKRDELRMILLGKTGGGKSASGNTILGMQAFQSELSPTSWTTMCKRAEGDMDGRQVVVVDTPGLFDTNFTEDEVMKKINTCISMSAPGPHVLLVVLKLGRFTKEEEDTVNVIQSAFGVDAAKYSMVLFTHGDKLKKQTIETFISKSEKLQDFIRTFQGRYHVFNNETTDRQQVRQLLEKVDRITTENGGGHYTVKMFKKAQKASKKYKKRLSKMQKAEEKKKREGLEAEVRQEMGLTEQSEKQKRCVLQ
ncbi:GTPase IMAP family member 8-like [Pholidichthys leucotaenia]